MRPGKRWLLVMLLLGGMPLSWAATFSDVTYRQGYPGFPESEVRGTLVTESEGIHFMSSSGRTWVIPYPALEEHRWQENTESAPGGGPGLGFIAGPHPLLLASSLGFTALNYALRRGVPQTRHTYLYTLKFRDYNGVSQEVSLSLPSQSLQKQLLEEVSHQLASYQQRMRDQYLQVMQPHMPPVIRPPEPYTDQATHTSYTPQSP